ncbi:MAG: acyl-CoA/acyl-ACP dehydrogenase [Deltaproteobacteria bacterium]|jgi:alkylation response protein AidB-like acyl-CoA dehydrogenase|nr:acyl-CoA/acyl-ACP dehydrogenase [Deltaproteobacteria bacterium]MBW2189913.1 acyl-CoA/acyl-ACP dehydrogenase [Deltaproteobacteria bacterium]
MDLQFTEEQKTLRDMVKTLCTDASTTDDVRKLENDPLGLPGQFWEQMKETGLLAMRLPEEHGGMGLTLLDCVVIFEELGRGLASGPIFESSVMAVTAISNAGTDAQKSLLESLGAGETIITPAWLEPDNGFGPQGVQMRAEVTSDGYRLNGIKRHVFYGQAADKLLVLVRTGDDTEALDLLLVDRDTPGVELQQQESMASDTQYKVTFTDVVVPADNRVGAEHAGWKVWSETLLAGLPLLGAYAVGAAQQALDITVQYSKEREQFDKPIGAFQALAHYMSDAVAVLGGAKTLVLEAAWAFDQGNTNPRLPAMAKLFACNAFRDTTAMAEQVYGGYGFTLEYDIQLYFRRAKQLQINWWDSRYLEEMIAADVLDGDSDVTIPDPFAA